MENGFPKHYESCHSLLMSPEQGLAHMHTQRHTRITCLETGWIIGNQGALCDLAEKLGVLSLSAQDLIFCQNTQQKAHAQGIKKHGSALILVQLHVCTIKCINSQFCNGLGDTSYDSPLLSLAPSLLQKHTHTSAVSSANVSPMQQQQL